MNKERYRILKKNKICVRCEKKQAESERVMCSQCLEKERNRVSENRRALVNLGFCPRCGKNRLFGEEKMCIECREKMYKYNKQHRSTKTYNYTQIRKQNGLCIKCGKREPVSGKTKCMTCAYKERMRARDYRIRKGIDAGRSERPYYGKCYFCGEKINSGKICEKCKEKAIKNLPESKGNEYWKNENKLIFGG